MSRLPATLKPGDEVRVIAPSDPLDKTKKSEIIEGFAELGLRVSFGAHCFRTSCSSEQKLDDLHNAFADPKIRAVFAGTGGFSANELLPHIDYKLIKTHPKIFAGYSDITTLLNAIYAQTGLITYHTINASGVGDKYGQEFTHDYLRKCLFSRQMFELNPAQEWFNKDYTESAPRYKQYKNDNWWGLNEQGIVEGRLVGGNLTCLLLLAGTKYFPKLKGSILFLEDDYESQPHHFVARLRSLILQPGFNRVEGIMIGRFQPKSQITRHILQQMLKSIPELETMPIVANVDFGHTKPQVTLPIGGIVQLAVLKNRQTIKLVEH